KAKTALLTLLAVSLSLAAAGLLACRAFADKAVPPAAEEAAAPPPPAAAPDEAPGEVAYSGQVVDPDGKPVANAKLFLFLHTPKGRPFPVRGTTGADGRYRFAVRKAEFDTSYNPEPWKHTAVCAVADGYGLGLPRVSYDRPLTTTEDVTVQLVR